MTIEEYLQCEREAIDAGAAYKQHEPNDWMFDLQREAVAAVDDPRLDAIVRLAMQLVHSYPAVPPSDAPGWYGVGGLVVEAIMSHVKQVDRAQALAQRQAKVATDGLSAVIPSRLVQFREDLQDYGPDAMRRYLEDLAHELT